LNNITNCVVPGSPGLCGVKSASPRGLSERKQITALLTQLQTCTLFICTGYANYLSECVSRYYH